MREYGRSAFCKTLLRRAGYVVLSVVLFLTAGSCAVITVQGRERQAEAEELEQFYRRREAELVLTIRDYLGGRGYPNSGVTMTHTVDGTGQRSYTILVHHRRISALDETGRGELAEELAGLCFSDENCSFRTEFLIR